MVATKTKLTHATNELENLELDLDDMRAQSYDNGANMKGKHRGVQKRIRIDLNPSAVYIPCVNHALNLALNDTASASGEIKGFYTVGHFVETLLIIQRFDAKRNKHYTLVGKNRRN